MADAVADFVKLLLIPGSTSFLLLAVTLGAIVALGPSPRARRWALAEITAVIALYWVLSIPAVADLLATRFQRNGPPQLSASDVIGSDAIVVLGAGVVTHTLHGYEASVPDRQTVFNAFEGARLFHLFPKPVPVVASGGVVNSEWQRDPESVVIRDLLVRGGVPANLVILESESRTTHEQAMNLAPMIRRRQWKRVILVAPSVQMPRAVAAFAAAGIPVTPAEASFHSDARPGGPPEWLPNGDALTVSSRAAYDYLAWSYYWMRGWLAPASTSPAPSRSPGSTARGSHP